MNGAGTPTQDPVVPSATVTTGIPVTPTTPTPNTPTSPTTPNSGSTPNSKKRSRGNYNCGKCGQKKRGHVCTMSSQPDSGGEKGSKSATPSVSEGANATLLASMGSMFSPGGMVGNHATGLAENEQLKAENEQLKKIAHDLEQQNMYLQQENNNLRAKIYELTAQLQATSGSHERDLLIYKTSLGSEMPSIGGGDYVPQGEMRNHMVDVDNTHAASDLNDLSNVAQQIGDSARANEPQTGN